MEHIVDEEVHGDTHTDSLEACHEAFQMASHLDSHEAHDASHVVVDEAGSICSTTVSINVAS